MGRRLLAVVLALVFTAGLIACSPPQPEVAEEAAVQEQPSAPATTQPEVVEYALEGPQWVLLEITSEDGGGLVPAAEGGVAMITLEGGDLTGNTGVNNVGGTYELKADREIEIKPGALTKMAGPVELMDQESAFLAALNDTEKYRIDDDLLTLIGEEEVVLMVLQAPAP